MPATLLGSIGMPSIHLLCDESGYIRQGCEKRHSQIALSGDAFQNCGQPKSNPITPCHRAEVAERQQNYIAIAQGFPNAKGTTAVLGLLLAL